MENFTTLNKAHQENNELTSKMEFYKDEIRILKNRLSDVAKDLKKEKDLKEIERLQNQLEIQENNVNNITHAIRNDEKFIDKTLSKGPSRETKSREEQHQKELDLVLSFERNFKEVRKAIKDLSPH
jgi:predicted  nucleic acid-binding Zn-ribbon protein